MQRFSADVYRERLARAAARIGEALEKGEAIAFLSQANIAPQIDRVVAVFPDGRAYAWHQLSPEAEQ